jgi:hypothetical protein
MVCIPGVSDLDLGPEAGHPKLLLVLLQEDAGILSLIRPHLLLSTDFPIYYLLNASLIYGL